MGKYDQAPTVAAALIRIARQRASLTQTELAESAGVTQQTVSAYETGRKEPTLPTLQKLLAAAGLELRMRLEPIDRHDEVLTAYLNTLPVGARVELEEQRNARSNAALRRRVKGK